METSVFNQIKTVLEYNVFNCEYYLDKVKTTEDLKNLSVGQLQELITFCREQESKMTRVVQCELYHVIGMGNLTVIQESKILSLIKKWTSYRGDIRTLAQNTSNILNLPNLPIEPEYECEILGIKLSGKVTKGKGRESIIYSQEIITDNIKEEARKDSPIPDNVAGFSISKTTGSGRPIIKYNESIISKLADILIASKASNQSKDNLVAILKQGSGAVITGKGCKARAAGLGNHQYMIVMKLDEEGKTFFNKITNYLKLDTKDVE